MNKRKLEHEGLLPRSIFPSEIHPVFSDDNSDGEVAMSDDDDDNKHDADGGDGSDNDDNDGVFSISW